MVEKYASIFFVKPNLIVGWLALCCEIRRFQHIFPIFFPTQQSWKSRNRKHSCHEARFFRDMLGLKRYTKYVHRVYY